MSSSEYVEFATEIVQFEAGGPLPNYEYAWIPAPKLTGYVLNLEHPRGQHKAYVFASTLGIYQEDGQFLSDQILETLPEAEAIRCQIGTPWGPIWKVPMLITGRNARTRWVTTGWITPWDGGPRFTTAFIEKSERNRDLEARERISNPGRTARTAS